MLRFTGDIWRNHPCCVVCMNELQVTKNPEWSQKVMNAIVKAQVYSQENKQEVARLLSKDGEKYLPMKAKVVERAMTLYSQDAASRTQSKMPAGVVVGLIFSRGLIRH